MIPRSDRRQSNGVKHVSDLYRTIKGERYIAWSSFPSDDRIAAYRAAGLRVAKRGEELFIHEADVDEAPGVDARERKAGRLSPGD